MSVLSLAIKPPVLWLGRRTAQPSCSCVLPGRKSSLVSFLLSKNCRGPWLWKTGGLRRCSVWLACGRGLDVTCSAGCVCWGMKGKDTFQSYWEAALSHTRCGYNPQDSCPQDSRREREPELPSARFVGVLKSWAYRCKVMEVGSCGGSQSLGCRASICFPIWCGKGFFHEIRSDLTGTCRGDGNGKGLAPKVS